MVVGALLLTKLITQDPHLAHSKVEDISDISKSNIATVLDAVPTPLTLDEVHTRESIIADLIMNKEFHKGFVRELRKWKKLFLTAFNHLSDKERVKDFFMKKFWKNFEKGIFLSKY